MRKVSIRTAQNIVIDFQMASLTQRILAFFIDLAAMGVAVSILAFFLALLDPILVYGAFLVFFFYTPLFEIFMNGQTIGKRMMRTRVVAISGKEPALFDYLIRWAFRMVDIYFTVGSLAVIFVSTTGRSQRLGGVLSNTMVIALDDEMALSLKDILRIEDRSVYAPEYPEAHRFSEDEMLTVKAVLDRYARYNNAAHRSLVEAAATKCAGVLNIEPVPQNKADFLKTLVKDYVVITRS